MRTYKEWESERWEGVNQELEYEGFRHSRGLGERNE